MPFFKTSCPLCNRNINVRYDQTIFQGEVSFFLQYNCVCGFSRDEDSDITPDKFRQEIIKDSGLWELKCSDKLKCIKFLRQKYLYTMEQIKQLKAEEIIRFEGTEMEIKVLGINMEKESIKFSMRRIK